MTSKIYFLSGPTCAGKSTAARILETLGMNVVKEELPLSFSKDMTIGDGDACFHLQKHIVCNRFSQWKKTNGKTKVFFDRSLDEDLDVFCAMHSRLGNLTPEQHSELAHTTMQFIAEIPPPSLILFFIPTFETLLKRSGEANQPSFITNNMEMQIDLYEQWLASRPEPILKIDNTQCPPDELLKMMCD